MVPGRSSKAIVIIVGLWVAACAAALALATTSDQAVAQQGCGGGGSPSPSGSASGSPPATDDPLPSLPVTVPPVPAPDAKHAVPDVDRDDPSRKVPVGVAAQQQQQCKSTVTLAYESGKNPKWTGKVGSDEPMCRRARDITIKKIKRGNDPTVGKGVTNNKGKYTIPARNANGRFYAKAAKATVENDDGQTVNCGAARSRAIRP
jgi:hypothetical protein